MENISSIMTIGEILVEFVSHKTGCALSQIAEYSGPYPSGAPAIFLDQAARMGASTQMIGGVGKDGFGRVVLERLRGNGVGIDGVTISPGLSTGVAFVSYYENGTRDFIFHLSNTAADQFELPKTDRPGAVLLHVSASSLGNAKMRAQIMAMVEAVSDAGGKISCDPNARPELMRDDAVRGAMTEVMARSFCLLPSTSDLGFLYPDLSEEAAIEQMLSMKAEVIALKRGHDGATIIGEGGARHDFAGHQVDEIDPTGAGDCFCGTFLAQLSQGASLHDAGRYANAAGALAVTKRGPMEGNSSPAQITAFLEATT